MELFHALSIYLAQHLNYILGAIGIFGFAAINSMPKNPPESFRDLWDWLRESCQTAIPVNRSLRQTLPDDAKK